MSAQSMQVITLAFADPDTTPPGQQTDFQRVNGSISYYNLLTFNIRTLSTNGASAGTDVTGLLYTPDLPSGDPCINASAPYVPANVTRKASLPATDFDLVAVAPWISPSCTLAYLESASKDPVRGFMFFPPDNSTDEPALPNSQQWSLGDGGRWKHENRYPVYVMPGAPGQALLRQSALYSGNLTQAPYGHILSGLYDPRDYVRLFVDVDTGSGSTLPSLWVFLLVVLGILLAIIGLTSVMMHWLQRRRRSELRRRVASGEVDLEALGIKRLTVPQEVLDRMPLYTYGTDAPAEQGPTVASGSAAAVPGEKDIADDSRSSSPSPSARPAPALVRTSSFHPTAFSQPTCAICLDDFIAPDQASNEDGTIVRELPCHHIFHPECVDTFLRDNSSLCPMCKKTVLPKGYCPRTITNAMVRRERIVRRLRERVSAEEDAGAIAGNDDAESQQQSHANANVSSLGRRIRNSTLTLGRSISSAPAQSQQMADLSSSPTAPQRSATTSGAAQRPVNSASRREWARQRAINMLGRRAPLDPDAEEAERMPRWRKVLSGVFPAAAGGGR